MSKQIFNLEDQQADLDSKIVVSLERIAEAFRVSLWEKAKNYKLSPIQIQVLIFLENHEMTMRTVSYLAKEFNMTKATISDAVRVLVQKELVEKEKKSEDARSYILQITSKGKAIAQEVAAFGDPLVKPLKNISVDQKEFFLEFLLSYVQQLVLTQVITPPRMCFTCAYYDNQEQQHYCKLLQQILNPNALRIDCPEHVQK